LFGVVSVGRGCRVEGERVRLHHKAYHLMLGLYNTSLINQSITMNGSDKSSVSNYLIVLNGIVKL
jgi:hypothetical protein